jgi:acyl-CoA thioesterase
MSQFALETAVEQVAENRWRGELCEGWRVGEVLNGGYLLAVAGRALVEALPHPDPLTVTGYFLAPTGLGPVECEVTPLRSSRNTSYASLTMYQAEQPVLQVTAAYGDLDKLKGEDWSAAERPDIPAFEDCPVTRQRVLEIRQRAEIRVVEGAEVFTERATTGTGRLTGWTRHADGADTDALSLLMFSDAFPPPIFTIYGPRHWVPTMELTVQVRARPAPGPLQVCLASRHLTRGVLEEDGRFWDSEGQLVAISRQTARLRL